MEQRPGPGAPAMRLQKFLARCGVASRRRCEAIIREGRVQVGGQVVQDPARSVRPGQDRVTVDGEEVGSEPPVYVVLHKPRGVLSAAADRRGRLTVVELVRRRGGPRVRLYPVGRLDLMSEGLLLLTNDGSLAYALTHPSRGVEKVYRVWVRGAVDDNAMAALKQGVALQDGPAAASRVQLVRRSAGESVLEITLHQGRKRQVRRMCEAVGHPVRRLVRVRIGPLSLKGLPPGAWRVLAPEEVEALYRAAGRHPRG